MPDDAGCGRNGVRTRKAVGVAADTPGSRHATSRNPEPKAAIEARAEAVAPGPRVAIMTS